jgi:hypothetical protein
MIVEQLFTDERASLLRMRARQVGGAKRRLQLLPAR